MKRPCWFSLLLIYLTAAERMEKVDGCLLQPEKEIWVTPGQSVALSCHVSFHCSNTTWNYEWFYFKEHCHARLKPLGNPLKYRLNEASLHISSLRTNDSAIYYCAAVSKGYPAQGLQHVGLGTTLVVRERFTPIRIVLLLSFVLLFIYSVALVVLIVKKHGCRKIHKSDKNNSSKKKRFHHVLQEMYRRENREITKKTATSTNRLGSSDDIYQNV
ncbi:Ig heavy chain V region B1-8/186-2 isoform X2 [Brachionichthys hirsutus]|uniref:Ig heavy chain V region B1-8/186-2 isoform X2 n=1 Tax=Brachionichthys hirsutus TaxID=412623 RepID=UPI00360464E1